MSPPVGAHYSCSTNGWNAEKLCFEWLLHFKQFDKHSNDEPLLLVLDNHACHISFHIVTFELILE
jgi:hypothetical protein